jgi:hypothetical protein
MCDREIFSSIKTEEGREANRKKKHAMAAITFLSIVAHRHEKKGIGLFSP